MCPLTLKLTLKAARCVGDHVDISNSAGSSDSAEESAILLNQMVLTVFSVLQGTGHSHGFHSNSRSNTNGWPCCTHPCHFPLFFFISGR